MLTDSRARLDHSQPRLLWNGTPSHETLRTFCTNVPYVLFPWDYLQGEMSSNIGPETRRLSRFDLGYTAFRGYVFHLRQFATPEGYQIQYHKDLFPIELLPFHAGEYLYEKWFKHFD